MVLAGFGHRDVNILSIPWAINEIAHKLSSSSPLRYFVIIVIGKAQDNHGYPISDIVIASYFAPLKRLFKREVAILKTRAKLSYLSRWGWLVQDILLSLREIRLHHLDELSVVLGICNLGYERAK
jgi:hypothetical protein